MDFDEGDNNNGITIIDITNLKTPRYCFMDFYGMESMYEVDLMTPLSAKSYLWAYYDKNDQKNQEFFGEVLKEFESWPLIHVDALAETWPRDNWLESINDDNRTDDDCSLAPHEDKQVLKATAGVQSLTSVALKSVLSECLEHDQAALESLPTLKDIPGFRSNLKSKLVMMAQANELQSSATNINLVHIALETEVDVDLGAFRSFSPEDTSNLISGLQENGHMLTLAVAGSQISEKELVVFMDRATPNTITFWETPLVSIKALANFLSNQAINVYHSGLTRRALYDDQDGYLADKKSLIDLDEFADVNPILQIVWAQYDAADPPSNLPLSLDSEDGPGKLLDRILGVERHSPELGIAALPLTDVPLSPTEFLTGLITFLGFVAHPKSNESYSMRLNQVGPVAAKAFAMGRSRLTGSAYQVAALPSRLSVVDHDLSSWPIEMKSQRPDQWGMLLFKVRYNYEPGDNQYGCGRPNVTKYAMFTPMEKAPNIDNVVRGVAQAEDISERKTANANSIARDVARAENTSNGKTPETNDIAGSFVRAEDILKGKITNTDGIAGDVARGEDTSSGESTTTNDNPRRNGRASDRGEDETLRFVDMRTFLKETATRCKTADVEALCDYWDEKSKALVDFTDNEDILNCVLLDRKKVFWPMVGET